MKPYVRWKISGRMQQRVSTNDSELETTYGFTGLRTHARPGMLPHAVLDDMDAVRTAMEPFAVLLNQGEVEYRICFLNCDWPGIKYPLRMHCSLSGDREKLARVTHYLFATCN